MAKQDPGAIEAVGGVKEKGGAQAANPTKDTGKAEATKAGKDGGAKSEKAEATNRGDAPSEGVELSDEAKADLEAKKAQEAEEARKQAELEAKMQEIEELKAQIAQAEKDGDEAKVKELSQKLESKEAELAAMFDPPTPPQGTNSPAGGGGMPNLIPPPAGGGGMGGGMPMMGGGMPMMGGGMPMMGGGMPGMGGGFPGGSPLGGGFQTPSANPSKEIPDFGKGASKKEIGHMLDAASEKYGVPANLLKAVAWQESTWNSKALSFDGHHGKGVMQIDDRFHEFARTPNVFDPKKNIEYGTKYLRDLYEQTGSWQAALKRYNGGSDYPPKIMALAQRQPWSQYA